MTQALKNTHILVTRPEEQGKGLCQNLVEEGAIVTHLPSIAFAPAPDEAQFEQAIKSLGDADWIIFNSPQAVISSAAAIHAAWPSLPSKLKIAAIGGGTAEALAQAGLKADLYPDQDWHSEGVLDLPVFQSVQGQKIAIVRGLGGREYLDRIFKARGAQVLAVIAYQRVLPKIDPAPCIELLKEGSIHALVCSSFEGVQNIKTLMGEKAWEDLRICPLVVMSERIKRLAQDLGFQTIWVASKASPEAIVTLLKNKLYHRAAISRS